VSQPEASTQPMKIGRRSKWLSIVGLLISGLFVALSLRKVDLDALGASIGSARIVPLCLTQLVKALAMLMMALRTRVILQGLTPLSVGPIFRGHLQAFAANAILPFRLGELYRVHYMAVRGEISHAASLAAAGLERLCDMLCLLILFLAAMPALDQTRMGTVYVLAGALALGCVVALWVARHPERFVVLVSLLSRLGGRRVGGYLTGVASQFARGLTGLSSARAIIGVFALSFCYWGVSSLSLSLVLSSLQIEVPYTATLVVLGFVAFGTAIPSSPAFVGTYHFFAASALATVFDVGATEAASFAVLSHFVAFVPFALVGGIMLTRDLQIFRSLARAAQAVSMRPAAP